MLRLLYGYQLATTVSNLRMIHGKALISTVDMLKERANGYLADNDTAQASEESFQIFNKLCRFIVKKADQAKDIVAGWGSAYKFRVKGWTQNDLSVEDVKFSLPFVIRFIDIVDGDQNVNREMATYVKENLYTINIDEIAAEIYEESNDGKITQLLQKT
ncbi:unnamed protein product [Caenorhabditis bovis]|uniref:Uncharacterized protein n=1 Tax=Caenorhabditis bovis TaxID=2654633 RepID=A0A8S1ESA0_9PELO|nr:unnamed protein product [Caenorhabditis bovis]